MLKRLSQLALAVLLAAAVAFASPADDTKITVQENVTYSSPGGNALRLDVYAPATRGAARVAAVVLIHGGSWMSLDKSTMRGIGSYFARNGLVAFSVDYRLLQGKRNRWPTQLDDVQCAVRWVRANAAKYNIDPARVGAFGHSAGAQIAALLGMEDTRDNSDPALAKYSSRVQAVVDVSGPTDFTNLGNDADGMEFLANFFGTEYDRHPNVWREASPALRFPKHDATGLAAFLIFHGTRDETVPISQSEELFKKLKAAGDDVAFTKVDDAHTFRTPEALRQLATGSLAFFLRTLAMPGQ